MAVRNKTRGKIVKDAIEPEPKPEPEPVTDTTTDIDDKLDQLKRDVQDE